MSHMRKRYRTACHEIMTILPPVPTAHCLPPPSLPHSFLPLPTLSSLMVISLPVSPITVIFSTPTDQQLLPPPPCSLPHYPVSVPAATVRPLLPPPPCHPCSHFPTLCPCWCFPPIPPSLSQHCAPTQRPSPPTSPSPSPSQLLGPPSALPLPLPCACCLASSDPSSPASPSHMQSGPLRPHSDPAVSHSPSPTHCTPIYCNVTCMVHFE